MKIVKGYLWFVVLVILNSLSIAATVTGVLDIKNYCGWVAFALGSLAILGAIASIALMYLTGWVLSKAIEATQ